jgi:hypothetical protein
MAEPIGIASGLLALATFTFKTSTKLYGTIQSYSSHPRQVRELLTELSGLIEVLQNLSSLPSIDVDLDLSALRLALEQCHTVCGDFEDELIQFSSRCSSDRTDFRDWAKFKFRGSDSIDGFRQQLVGYKATISVALSFATLRTSSITVEAIQSCRSLVETTTIDLEDRLAEIVQKLEDLSLSKTGSSGVNAEIIKRVEGERISTEKALQLCTELSQHIDEIQRSYPRDDDLPHLSDSGTTSNRLFSEGIDGCKDYVAFALSRLEKHRQAVASRLEADPKGAGLSDDKLLLQKLQSEAHTLRHGLKFFSNVDSFLEEQMSNIENHAEGDDTIQLMVSTDGRPINGKNHGVGSRLKQAGGHYDNASLQQVSQDFTSISLHQTEFRKTKENQSTASSPETPHATPESQQKVFSGPGFTLARKH